MQREELPGRHNGEDAAGVVAAVAVEAEGPEAPETVGVAEGGETAAGGEGEGEGVSAPEERHDAEQAPHLPNGLRRVGRSCLTGGQAKSTTSDAPRGRRQKARQLPLQAFSSTSSVAPSGPFLGSDPQGGPHALGP